MTDLPRILNLVIPLSLDRHKGDISADRDTGFARYKSSSSVLVGKSCCSTAITRVDHGRNKATNQV